MTDDDANKDDAKKDDTKKDDGLNGARLAMAAVVLGLFTVCAVYLVTQADTKSQREWEHLVYVFGGFEAIAFTAIGWLFGGEVNRQRADKAEDNADKADKKADDAAKKASEAEQKAAAEATKGATLAGLVVGGSGGVPEGRQRLESLGATAGNAGVSGGGLAAALEFARANYPVSGGGSDV